MSNRTQNPRRLTAPLRKHLARSSLLIWAALIGLVPNVPVQAAGLETALALVQPANLQRNSLDNRQCWARYSTSGAQPRNGVIEETAFRVPCPELMTSDFVATLQRALAARGHYDGPITGRADPATRDAVRFFQRAQGFDSPILTLDTAQRLGLVPANLARN